MGNDVNNKFSEIIEKSLGKTNSTYNIEYKCNLKLIEEQNENLEEYNNNKSLKDEIKNIDSPLLDIKNVNKFPYNSLGFISVKFPSSDENNIYTCFVISQNLVITLASNLINENKGRKAISILTSFSKEQIKWDNIFIQSRNTNSNNDLKSELAAIIYENNVCNEWIGVEGGKKEKFLNKNIYTIFTFGIKDIENNINYNKREPYLREIEIKEGNPFKEAYNSNKNQIVKKAIGSPCYYKYYNNGAYVIAIINEFFEFQYFDKNDMIFLNDMVYNAYIIRKLIHNDIGEDNIVKLDLSWNGYGPLDVIYLTDFDLKNLRILDLSSNSIKSQGAFYISQGRFNNLESLNLNFNKIGDEGVNHISNSCFSKLSYLYLFHTDISSKGINYLVKAKFTNNLIILSLSDNKIGDNGVRILTENKVWNRLDTLNLNSTRITDISLEYFVEAFMPKLKKLNILGNKFTENGKIFIDGLRKNQIHISYRFANERKKELEKKRKEKDN